MDHSNGTCEEKDGELFIVKNTVNVPRTPLGDLANAVRALTTRAIEQRESL